MQNDKEKIEKLTNKIDTRLQFIITILVLFLALIPTIQIKGTILIVIYIIDWIVFAYVGDKITNEKYLSWLNNIIIVGIGSYIIPLFTTALATQEGIISYWQGYLLISLGFISAWLILLIPIIFLIMLTVLKIKSRK